MTESKKNPEGLTAGSVKKLQAQYGKNELLPQKKVSLAGKLFRVMGEPMFLLLLAAAVIYFILGEPGDGAVMLVFVAGVISIDVIQEWKTDHTLNALIELSAPKVTVIRDGREQEILSAELVPGDVMLICEGVKVPADGAILSSSDLCVDESTLSGESKGAWKLSGEELTRRKSLKGGREEAKKGGPEEAEKGGPEEDYWRRDFVYAGTLAVQGSAVVQVEKTGGATEYGKIGKHVAEAPDVPAPLKRQTNSLVRCCTIIAAVLFALVTVFTYLNLPVSGVKDRLIESILSGITLAMAMIPEEFPVVLTVFLSLGAWRLAKKHSLVRRLASVEALGAVSVLCVDKTGTITENQMKVQEVWALNGDVRTLAETMGLGCETDAYDPMETAMLDYCREMELIDGRRFDGELWMEYPFTHEQKMMGHVWNRKDGRIIAAKGSMERILSLCELSQEEQDTAGSELLRLSGEGLRVIAVARRRLLHKEPIPSSLSECNLIFLGLIGLSDPPRESIQYDIERCRRAGIRVVMITGDYQTTAAAVAKKIGMTLSGPIVTGDMLNRMSSEKLRETVKTAWLFSRVIPEHKMRIVKALKENGEIAAMTGDGVNDAPALKYADIGIAMGKRGSQVSREAADIILMDDNFTTIVETVKDGRRIYDNIRKAVGYIFTIHIPIALSSLLAPVLGILPSDLLLLPIHVVLMELMIDPTCSVVLERQPAEEDIMDRPPRDPKEKLLNCPILIKSVIQGLALFGASFLVYFFALSRGTEDPGADWELSVRAARTMGLSIIILGNLFLVLVNSSDHDLAVHSLARLMRDKIMRLVFAGTLISLAAIIYSPLNIPLKLTPLSMLQLFISAAAACLSVCWYEAVKLFWLIKKKSQT